LKIGTQGEEKGKNPNPILVDGKHKSIISEELWGIVQARRKSRSIKQKQSNDPFLLSSLLRCPDCGQGMVPSITTATRKDGTKKKHRYYVCSNFHNKGSSACKANSIRAYQAEEEIINRLLGFLSDSESFISTIEGLNKQTVHSTMQIKDELEQIVQQLVEVNALQEKYMQAFEQNLFPIAILQERLQKISSNKTELEQKKNELSIYLSSSDSKVIPPNLVRILLEKFVAVFQQSTRDRQKQLFQLLLKRISIKQSKDRSRYVDNIELDFDFSEVNISKTFTLIHMLYRETDKEYTYSQTLPASNNKMPPYLQQFLPLFVVRFSVTYLSAVFRY